MPINAQLNNTPRETLDLYQTVLNSFPNGAVVLFDTQKRYILAGGDELGGNGIFPADIIGKTPGDVHDEGMASFLDEIFTNTLAGNNTTMDVQHGSEFFEITTRQICNAEGTPMAGMVITQNITGRTQGQRLIHERQEVYRNLIDNAPDIIIRFDKNLRILFINQAITRYSIRSRKEFIGIDLFSLGLSDENKAKLTQAVGHVFDSETEAYLTLSIPTKHRQVTFDIRIAPEHDVSGNMESALCVARDITGLYDLEREKERLLELVEVTPDIVYTMDGAGKLLYCNKSASSLLLIPDESDVTSWSMQDIHPPEDYKFLKNEALPHATEEGIWTGETHLLCREGSHISVKQTILAQKASDEGSSIFSVIAHDLSQLKAHEHELKKAKERAEAASRSKSEFLANMSHEIRTPISGILGMAELMLKDPAMRMGRDKLEMISHAGQSLLGIINDVLDLSKLEARGIEIINEPFFLERMVDNIRDMFEHLAAAKELEFAIKISEKLPAILVGDEQRIAQILRNLLSNAIKFTHAGSVTLDISPQKTNDGQTMVLFQVKDTGVGIAEDKQKMLFTSFKQLDSSYSKQHGGTGLGLAISKEFVGLMDGNLSVSSTEGKGSVFSFSLPLAEPTAQQKQQTLHDKPVTHKQHNTSFNILAVDDNAINRLFLQGILEEDGHTVTLAKDAFEALEILENLENKVFDCILMDVQLPGMDGVAATHKIRSSGKEYASIPIIALTAYAMEGDKKRFLEAGMNEYISKPVEGPELIEIIYQSATNQKPAQKPENAAAPEENYDLLEKEERNLRSRHATLRQSHLLYDEFLSDIVQKKKAMQEAWENRQDAVLAHLAHSLAGAAGVLGLLELLAYCRALDAKVTKLHHPLEESDVQELFDHMDTAARVVKKVLEEYSSEN